MNQDLTAAVRSFGASSASVARIADGPPGFPFAVSVAVRLSDAIIDEIAGEPTYTYFNHYRSVNALIDQILLKSGIWLQERGARYITVAASQSAPGTPFAGRYSHKKAACLSLSGSMGRNGLFMHSLWGPRVRLGTVFTDWEGCSVLCPPVHTSDDSGIRFLHSDCSTCCLCVSSCPAHALAGVSSDEVSFDAEKCSAWMKKTYQHIGRGVVCGICMQVCPVH
jgi:epoxyqueuosine reductase